MTRKLRFRKTLRKINPSSSSSQLGWRVEVKMIGERVKERETDWSREEPKSCFLPLRGVKKEEPPAQKTKTPAMEGYKNVLQRLEI